MGGMSGSFHGLRTDPPRINGNFVMIYFDVLCCVFRGNYYELCFICCGHWLRAFLTVIISWLIVLLVLPISRVVLKCFVVCGCCDWYYVFFCHCSIIIMCLFYFNFVDTTHVCIGSMCCVVIFNCIEWMRPSILWVVYYCVLSCIYLPVYVSTLNGIRLLYINCNRLYCVL